MDTTFVPPDTKCNKCIFREENDCRINKLTVYHQHNIPIEYGDNGPVIKRFICPYYRETEWLDTQKNHSNLLEAIREENGFPYIAILLFMEGTLLEKAIKKITSFSIAPKEIFVVSRPDVDVRKLISEIQQALDGTNIKWNLHCELEDSSWHSIFKFFDRSEYLLIVNSVPSVSNKWPDLLAKKIQDDLLKFSYAENKEQNMMLIAPYVYRMYYFTFGKEFIKHLRLERYRQKCVL